MNVEEFSCAMDPKFVARWLLYSKLATTNTATSARAEIPKTLFRFISGFSALR